MPNYDYLIIGGGIAGTTAAETIRQKDKSGRIAVLSAEPHFLYSRVLLPEFIRGEAGLDKVMLRNAEDYKKNGIEIFLGEEAEKLNARELNLKTKSGKEFKAKKILIASGGRPKLWGVENQAPESVFRLQSLDDALRIKKFLSEHEAGKVFVVGGGFMALEFIEILKHYGWKITLLCKEKSFWPDFLDESGFEILSDTWQKNGVEMIFGHKETELRDRIVQADFVGVGIGLERNLDFLPVAMLEVNKHLETAFPSVWAAGDVALYIDPFSGRKRFGGNWSGAFMQGRIAGLNMAPAPAGQAGEKEVFKTISTYAITHLGLNLSFVGDAGPFSGDFGAEGQVLCSNKEKNEYVRVFTKKGAVIGAAMINGQKFLGAVNRAIINKWDASNVFKKSI